MKKFLKVLKFLIMIALLVVSIDMLIYVSSNFSRLTERFGVIDVNGNTIIDFKYGVINLPENGNLKADAYEATTVDFFWRPVKSQYIDLNGKVCFDTENEKVIYPIFKCNRAPAYSLVAEKEGFMNIYKKKISSFTYDEVDGYERGYAVVYKDDENSEYMLEGLIDLDENLVLSYKYSYIKVLSDPFFKVYIDEDKYIAKKNDELVTEKIEDDMVVFKNMNDLSALGPINDDYISFLYDMIIVVGEDTESLYDENGHLLYTFKNAEVHAPVNTKYFVIYTDENPHGYVVDIKDGFKTVYTENKYKIWNVLGERAIVLDEERHKYGMVDFSGNIVVPIEYDAIGAVDTDPDHVIPTIDKKIGLMDLDGNVLIEPTSEYRKVLLGDGNTYIACKRDKTLYIAYKCIIYLIVVYFLFLAIKFIKFIKLIMAKKKK